MIDDYQRALSLIGRVLDCQSSVFQFDSGRARLLIDAFIDFLKLSMITMYQW